MSRGRWRIRTYETAAGRKPVDDWIRNKRNVPSKDKALIFRALKAYVVPLGTQLQRPHGAVLRGGLHELRVRSKDGRRHYRIVYFKCPRGERAVIVVLGIVKKSGAIPKEDMKLALERKKDWERRFPHDRAG